MAPEPSDVVELDERYRPSAGAGRGDGFELDRRTRTIRIARRCSLSAAGVPSSAVGGGSAGSSGFAARAGVGSTGDDADRAALFARSGRRAPARRPVAPKVNTAADIRAKYGIRRASVATRAAASHLVVAADARAAGTSSSGGARRHPTSGRWRSRRRRFAPTACCVRVPVAAAWDVSRAETRPRTSVDAFRVVARNLPAVLVQSICVTDFSPSSDFARSYPFRDPTSAARRVLLRKFVVITCFRREHFRARGGSPTHQRECAPCTGLFPRSFRLRGSQKVGSLRRPLCFSSDPVDHWPFQFEIDAGGWFFPNLDVRLADQRRATPYDHQPHRPRVSSTLTRSAEVSRLPVACYVTSPAPTAASGDDALLSEDGGINVRALPRTSRPCSRISTLTATESSTWRSSRRRCPALTPSCTGRTRKAPSPSRPSRQGTARAEGVRPGRRWHRRPQGAHARRGDVPSLQEVPETHA